MCYLSSEFLQEARDAYPKYPTSFIEAVKDFYLDWEELHQALDRNIDGAVKTMLNERKFSITAAFVVRMINDGHIQELRVEAERSATWDKLSIQCNNIMYPGSGYGQ